MLSTWFCMFIWSYHAEVNAKRIREAYLKSVLRQEIAYFDNVGAGEITTRIQSDTGEPLWLLILVISAQMRSRSRSKRHV
jgi:ABC-type multidrug transport system fused ATPase/permease subunit